MEQLGTSLEQIAFEKAGIAVSGRPHLIGPMPSVAARTIRAYCREIGALPVSIASLGQERVPGTRQITFALPSGRSAVAEPILAGPHQINNAQVAIGAALLAHRNGLPLSSIAIRQGLRRTVWPGRFQMVRVRRRLVVLDVAHNVGGARVFGKTWREQFGTQRGVMILGLVKKKEHQQMISLLRRTAQRIILTPLPTHRTMQPDELLADLDWGSAEVHAAGSIAEALNEAFASMPKLPLAIVGSHYLVGDCMDRLGIT